MAKQPKEKPTIVRIRPKSRRGHRGFFVVLDDDGDQLSLRRITLFDGRPFLAEFAAIRKADYRITKPQARTLEKKGFGEFLK